MYILFVRCCRKENNIKLAQLGKYDNICDNKSILKVGQRIQKEKAQSEEEEISKNKSKLQLTSSKNNERTPIIFKGRSESNYF